MPCACGAWRRSTLIALGPLCGAGTKRDPRVVAPAGANAKAVKMRGCERRSQRCATLRPGLFCETAARFPAFWAPRFSRLKIRGFIWRGVLEGSGDLAAAESGAETKPAAQRAGLGRTQRPHRALGARGGAQPGRPGCFFWNRVAGGRGLSLWGPDLDAPRRADSNDALTDKIQQNATILPCGGS